MHITFNLYHNSQMWKQRLREGQGLPKATKKCEGLDMGPRSLDTGAHFKRLSPRLKPQPGSQRQNGALSVLLRLSRGCHEPHSIETSGKDAAIFKSLGRVVLAWL